jgi:hypothetical protein
VSTDAVPDEPHADAVNPSTNTILTIGLIDTLLVGQQANMVVDFISIVQWSHDSVLPFDCYMPSPSRRCRDEWFANDVDKLTVDVATLEADAIDVNGRRRSLAARSASLPISDARSDSGWRSTFLEVANQSGIGYRPARPVLDSWLGRRVGGPLTAWCANRWHWRRRRQVRAEVDRLRAMVVPAASLQCAMTAATKRVALLFDRLPVSTVLFYGYGMGEAVAVAATIDSSRVEPLTDALQAFTDEEILGHPDVDPRRMRQAVSSRNDLLDLVREIVSAHPKPGAIS